MADPKQIESEIKTFFEQNENMRKDDMVTGIMLIVKKHYELDKIDFLVTHYDLDSVISQAKSDYAKTVMPVKISGKEVRNPDMNYLLVIDAFIGYLNRNKLLKRLVKFDYRR